MKWKNFQRFGIGVLAVAGIAGVLFGGEGPRLGNVYWISSPSLQDYRVTVSQAVQVGNRYLAVLFLKPRNPEKARALVTQYGSISRVAPAWMGPGWEVIQVGEGEYGNPLTMNPRTPSEDMASTSYLFPQVLVRDVTDEECPYLWGTTQRLTCLNAYLEKRKVYEPPVQTRGYLVVHGEVWWKGSYRGYLLHRVDMQTRQIVESRLSIETLLEAFRSSRLDSDLVDEFQKQWEALRQRADGPPEQEAPREENGHPYPLRKWYQAIPSLELDVVVQGAHAYVLTSRPMAMAVFRWPSGVFDHLIPVRREDLPEWAHTYHSIRLIRLDVWRDERLALWELERAITYEEVLQSDPAYAFRLAQRWPEERPGEPLTPQTIVNTELTYLILRFDNRGVRGFVHLLQAFRGSRDVGFAMQLPFFTGDTAWIAVRDKRREEPWTEFGVARLTW